MFLVYPLNVMANDQLIGAEETLDSQWSILENEAETNKDLNRCLIG